MSLEQAIGVRAREKRGARVALYLGVASEGLQEDDALASRATELPEAHLVVVACGGDDAAGRWARVDALDGLARMPRDLRDEDVDRGHGVRTAREATKNNPPKAENKG